MHSAKISGSFKPTVAQFWVYNPAFAQVQNEHVFPNGWAEIARDGPRQTKADEEFKRTAEIFAKYPIAEA